MHKVWAVVRREFISRVQSRAFVVSTILGPLLMGALFVMPILLEKRQTAPKHVAVLDGAEGSFGRQVAERLRSEMRDTVTHTLPRYRVEYVRAEGPVNTVRDSLVALTGLQKAGPEGLDGVLVLTDSTIESGLMQYYGANVGSPNDMSALSSAVRPLVTAARLERAGVDPALVNAAERRVDLRTERVSDGKLTGQSGKASFMIAYFMGFVLYLATLIYGQQTMTSVIEEKTSRIMEVLTSSLTPFQMLLGKVLGVGLAGLTQMAIWVGSAFVLGSQGARLAGAFGVSAEAARSFAIPGIAPSLLVVFLLYFALGFLLYGALYAAIGAMCNTIQETQQYAIFVTMFVLVGFFAVFALIKDPTGTLGVTMSYIPFFSPFTMPVRWSMTSVPLLQLCVSLALMVLALLACVWLAARIYRTGILMYGKKPSWGELWRWIRA